MWKVQGGHPKAQPQQVLQTGLRYVFPLSFYVSQTQEIIELILQNMKVALGYVYYYLIYNFVVMG